MLNKLPKTIVGLDFETYFDNEYTLKKLATTDFIFDERFKAFGISVQNNDEPFGSWYYGEEMEKYLRSVDWSNTALLAHHTHFEALILSYHYNIIPAYYLDTMSMARALIDNNQSTALDSLAKKFGSKGKEKSDALQAVKGVRNPTEVQLQALGEYAVDDVEDTWRLFRLFYNDFQFPDEELDLIDITVRMYGDPHFVRDEQVATKVLRSERLKTLKTLRNIAQLKNIEGFGRAKAERAAKILSSDKQFAALLESLGAEVPIKISPRTGKETTAFSKNDLGFQKLQVHKDPVIRDVVAARIEVKSNINEKRASQLLIRGANDRPLPVYLNYCGAHTMRWSGGDKSNYQNYPSLRKSDIRKALRAPKGYKIVVVDSAQIEARMLATVAGQQDLITDFRNDVDVYSVFASEIYGVEVSKYIPETAQHRQVGKVGELQLGFGSSWRKFQDTLAVGAMSDPIEMSDFQAKEIVELYRSKRKEIIKFWNFCKQMIKLMYNGGTFEWGFLRFTPEGIDMPNGLQLHYPGISRYKDPKFGWSYRYRSRSGYTKLYHTLLVENIIQCLARVAMGPQVVEIAKKYPVLSMTHDEVVYLAKEDEAEDALEFGLGQLRVSPWWLPEIPLNAEGVADYFYSKS